MILFLVNTFPSDNKLREGLFNYYAAVQLSEACNLKIIHLRSWRPSRKIVEKKKIGKLNITVFSFPYYPLLFRTRCLTGCNFQYTSIFLKLFLENILKK